MDVDESLINNAKSIVEETDNLLADNDQKMDTESPQTTKINESLTQVCNEGTLTNQHIKCAESDHAGPVASDNNVSESKNDETIKDSAEKEKVAENESKHEAEVAGLESPDGEYVDKDELIPSVLIEPYNRPSGDYLLPCFSSPEHSDNSGFDLSDHKEDFEIWTSDTTSPECSDDPDDDKMEADSKQPPTSIPHENWKQIQPELVPNLEFTGNPHVAEFDLKEKFTPLQCFNLFVNDAVIDLLVTETNKFARSKFVKPGYHKDFLTGWIDVTPQEMREFIGLLIFMTIRRCPGIKYYWSGDELFSNPVAGRIMTETRFKRLLTFWHFGDDKSGGYPKVKNLINIFNENFRKYRKPDRILYVGKATLFLREKYAFQRGLIGIPKRGQRLLRLLDSEIYTYKVVILPPEDSDDRINQTKHIVLDLLHDYLDEGRLVIFHNLYISLDLAQEMLNRKTYAVGPIRKKARKTPPDLRKIKVKNNEVKGLQNSNGISVFKWRNLGHTCYGMSSCHGTETVEMKKFNKREGKTVVKEQSKFLRDFNISEKVFELAEKFSVTESPLNNETTWYRRLANDLLTGTCVSNAFCLYKKINNEKCKFFKFQDELWRQLVGFKSPPEVSSEDTTDDEG